MIKSLRKQKLFKDVQKQAASIANLSQQSLSNLNSLLNKQLAAPADQLKLTEKELDEEFTRILNANSPYTPQNISRWSVKEKTFKTLPYADHLMVHFEYEGYLVYKGSEEDAEGGEANELSAAIEKKQAPPKNMFNYGERATQTPILTRRERATNTDPPPSKLFSGSVTQWEIYDAYQEDLAAKERAKERQKAQQGKKDETLGSNAGLASNSQDWITTEQAIPVHDDYKANPEIKRSVMLLERMCNQNMYDDVLMDFKYWEDAADEFREGKGVLLPLWKFTYEFEKKKQITALSWHPLKKDVFAVGYGSYDFKRQGEGLLATFSLKNPSFPERIIKTESGVMCIEFHPKNDSWIVVGFYDGTVSIYDLSIRGSDAQIFSSTLKTGKHSDPVWEVRWLPVDADDHQNFMSVSTDGRVTQWALVKSELVCTDVIHLRVDLSTEDDVELMDKKSRDVIKFSGGTCFDVNKTNSEVFIVGTEDGRIFKCSKAYNRQYLKSFEPHQLDVYAIKYSPFCPNIFLTASADWTVKLWNHDVENPILVFDLGQSVGDISWSPQLSTVFAACTSDGRVFYYDLSVSKYDPICEQAVTGKSRLTHLTHNLHSPLTLVGDDHGVVMSFKQSPNLRKMPKNQEGQQERLEKIVNTILGRKDDSTNSR